MKLMLTVLVAAFALSALAADAPAKPSEVHAVLFYVTVDRETGVWTHAQVIGGYADHEACIHAVPIVGAATSADLSPGDIPVFLCPEIDVEGIKKQTEPEPAAPLQNRTQTPSSDT